MNLSVVIPLFNEQENIEPMLEELVAVLGSLEKSYEIILVDDGSRDRTYELACLQAESNRQIKLLRLRRNFGQTAAMAAGFDHASGDVVIPMDGDMQNDPRDISRLLDMVDEGYDVVSGWRKGRKDAFVSRKLPSMIANRIISRTTGVALRDYGCTLKAYRREVLSQVNLYGELHRFVPALASMIGARITEIPVNHRERERGVSKYGIDRTLRVVLDLITVKFLLKYSTRPMQLFGKWAFSTFVVSLLSGSMTLYMKLVEGLSMNRNPLLVLTAFLLFMSVQFVVMGLLGELVTRIYHEVQEKTIYTVRESMNL